MLAWDENTNGWWSVHEIVCEAGAEMERAQKETKDPEPGVLRYVSLSEDYEP